MDIQGFFEPINEFIVKEIAILYMNNDTYVRHLFEPPCEWNTLPAKYKSMNKWLTRNYHNLKWYDGNFEYDLLKTCLDMNLRNTSCVFVKGSKKKIFLDKLLNHKYNIIDITDCNCPSLRGLSTNKIVQCPTHLDSKFRCALKNVHIMKSWISNNSYDECGILKNM